MTAEEELRAKVKRDTKMAACFAIGLLIGVFTGEAIEAHHWRRCVQVCDREAVRAMEDGFCNCEGDWRPRKGN